MSFDYFIELEKQEEPQSYDAFTVRYHRLVFDGNKRDIDKLRSEWSGQGKFRKVILPEDLYSFWEKLEKPEVDLTLLPACSWFLQFTFTLAKPYISKDDNPFYIIDNPIVRDKVFRLPMVRPTSWKGNLYSAFWQLEYDKKDDAQMQRLFGVVRGKEQESSEEIGQAGRLFFYPTFFRQTGLEIINPHDRKRRVGKNPIFLECVPAGAKGTFSLLYVPFDRVGQDETETRHQGLSDLERVAEGLHAMFLTYGFSAKRTSGYGVAKENVENGCVQIRIEETPVSPITPPPHEPQLPKYLQARGKLKDEYLNPDGMFHERSQAELAKMTKPQRQEYEKAKKWWEREGKALLEKPAEPVPSEQPLEPQPQWLKREFSSLDDLLSTAKQLAQGGEG